MNDVHEYGREALWSALKECDADVEEAREFAREKEREYEEAKRAVRRLEEERKELGEAMTDLVAGNVKSIEFDEADKAFVVAFKLKGATTKGSVRLRRLRGANDARGVPPTNAANVGSSVQGRVGVGG